MHSGGRTSSRLFSIKAVCKVHMRIAYIVMQFPSPTETFAGSDVRALRRAGLQVNVFAMRPRHPEHDQMLRERDLVDVDVQPLTLRGFVEGLALMFSNPRWTATLLGWVVRWHAFRPGDLLRCVLLVPSALRITASIGRGRFDVVHLFWGHFPAMVGLLLQRYFPDVVVSMFLGAYDLGDGRDGRFLPGSRVVAQRADLVWTHSRSNLPRLRSLGVPDARLRCVHRGIDFTKFPSGAEARAREAGTVVAIGSLIERKAVGDVLRTIARVRSAVPHVRLKILGDGPDRAALQSLASSLEISDVMSFEGHVDSDTVSAELRRASALILMSREDRLPNVVKEAMASSCPCVVTHTQGMDELVIHERTGYLVGIGDVEAAATYLTSILLEPELHAHVVDAARDHVVQAFSADASMAAYARHWRGVLKAREPSPAEIRLEA